MSLTRTLSRSDSRIVPPATPSYWQAQAVAVVDPRGWASRVGVRTEVAVRGTSQPWKAGVACLQGDDFARHVAKFQMMVLGVATG